MDFFKTKYFIFALLSILVGSCKNIDQVLEKKNNIICLVDYSNSIDSKTIQSYSKGIGLILKKMGPDDRLNVYPIDEASSLNRVALVSEDFFAADQYTGTTFKLNLPDSISPPFKKEGENVVTGKKKRQERIKGYLKAVTPLIPERLDSIKKARNRYGHKSDIFSALYEIGVNDYDLFETDGDSDLGEKIISGKANNNYIIIFSDMIQESDLFDFNKATLNKEMNAKILETLRGEEMMPNLQHSKIIVFMNNNASTVSTRKLREVRNFWSFYFKSEELNIRDKRVNYISSDNLDNVIRLIFN